MLKKSFALGMVAALAMAPAALAQGQVQRSNSRTQITNGNFGTGSVSGIDSSTYTDQHQRKNSNLFCATGNQTQASTANTDISNGNVGFRNVSGISNSTLTSQRQNANCSFPYFR
ncbi:hypothetical protein NIES4071_91760 [Calothrix sp. NIES-4071]|nr:hypothetical protein NIES4071_91760 [Calothrix sp. NIES-4071]BAZ63443.1 hypothetical protein NIES4105_91690 [Calothrix sp. NIES-4105]